MTESRTLGAGHWKRLAAPQTGIVPDAFRAALICPDDDGPLEPAGDHSPDFRCPACGRLFPAVDGWLSARPTTDPYRLTDTDIATLRQAPPADAPADSDPARLYAGFWDGALGAMGDLAGRRVLDLGCGTGWAAAWFAARGADVAAVDVAAPSGKPSSERPIGWFQADACRLPFTPATFDCIFIASLLHTLRRPERALLEAIRVLAPDGVIINLGESIGSHGMTHGIGGRDPRLEGRALTLSDYEAMYHEVGLSFESHRAHESNGHGAGWLGRLRRHIANHASGGDRLFIARHARELELPTLRIPWRKGAEKNGG